jgi:hypothetical protein
MHRPDEERPERRLEIELRNGPALPSMLIDKVGGRWIELDPHSERLVRKEGGAKLDAERDRKRDVIVQLLYDEALAGKLYTTKQFAEKFENQAGLGGQSTIRERISVLATKGYVKFCRDGAPYRQPVTTSILGYLVVEGMQLGPPEEVVDPETGEVTTNVLRVLPSHFKAAETGAIVEVENPLVWVYAEGVEP